MNTKKIETAVYDKYCEGGFAAACEEADKYLCTQYEYCGACNNSVPTIKGDHGCLICGSETTTKDPDEEDIPLENYTEDDD